ncbi:MAG: Crp/Fnr family transcriptional regulator [Lachnospiraceae bacterium]|nr:Crp/Fnr family transcriptional regulator [Lachnospiraceae bacterium]
MGDFSKILDLTNVQEDVWLRDGLLYIREFEKGQVVMDGTQNNNKIGIILSGMALLESNALEDQRRILDYYESGDIFGGKCLPDLKRDLYYITALGRCRVGFVDSEKIMEENFQKEISMLNDSLMEHSTRRMIKHMDILAHRTIRQKLLIFLKHISRKKGRRSFSLPFPLTDCADYLAVDRSAMMRELKKMKEDGILRTQGRKIELVEWKE